VCLDIFTSSARAVAKYCGEPVCLSLCVCLSAHISQNHTRDLYQLCMLPMAVARSSSGRVTKFQEKRQFWGLSGPFKVLAIFAATVAAAFAAKGIIQYARQAQIGIRKILSAGDAAYRPGRGDGSAQRGRSLMSRLPRCLFCLEHRILLDFVVNFAETV